MGSLQTPSPTQCPSLGCRSRVTLALPSLPQRNPTWAWRAPSHPTAALRWPCSGCTSPSDTPRAGAKRVFPPAGSPQQQRMRKRTPPRSEAVPTSPLPVRGRQWGRRHHPPLAAALGVGWKQPCSVAITLVWNCSCRFSSCVVTVASPSCASTPGISGKPGKDVV